ncbi:endonuclease/exonuclease/phosphatase family protein [Candidatus Rhodobacter oscarellae]|uniref:endonuclease/exonuclease/phosphatase family protein n=1 Tax=Candidatus Rhodobacter oscarellae TaxID=1675527 RepID=UPI0009E5B45D|nr:endonuclease/exonuclease/phosphatase family protein [Candidatus Rhodobacter lobularis]
MATWHVELMRKGPGLLLRDMGRGDPQVKAVADVTAHVAPDILLLTGVDWDFGGATARSLADQLGFAHVLSLEPNAGLMTGLDLDGDGKLGGPADAQGYGRFRGHGGMVLLSKHEIGKVVDHSAALWADQPGALLPVVDGKLFPSEAAYEVQRLSSVGHWEVRVSGLRLLAFSAGPPVFDGPEDRNGRRNHDEITFWARLLDGEARVPLVILGNANLDPTDGDGRREAINGLLAHPTLQDPKPRSMGGAEAALAQGGVNAQHRGDPALDTADWRDQDGPGNLRVSYVLPSAGLEATAAGVFWPAEDDPLRALLGGGLRHHLVWVDLEL